MKTRKKIFLLLLALVTMLSFTASAATNKELYKKMLSYYKQGNYTATDKYAKKLPKTASTESCVKNMSSGMKKAYKALVWKYSANDRNHATYSKPNLWGYYLTDINADRKPELIIKYGTCEAAVETYIYKYVNGKAVRCASFGSGHTLMFKYPLGKGMIITWCHMGDEYTRLVQANGHTTTVLTKGGHRSYTNNFVTFPYQLKNYVYYDKNLKKHISFAPFN